MNAILKYAARKQEKKERKRYLHSSKDVDRAIHAEFNKLLCKSGLEIQYMHTGHECSTVV